MLNIKEIEAIIKAVSNYCLKPYYEQATVQSKADGSLVTQADIAIQAAIQTELEQKYPEYAFFAEELSEQDMTAFFSTNHKGYWCLDPLDGTSNFASGLPFFAISLALIIEGRTQFGIVYDPMRDECFTAVKGQGAFLNGNPLKRNQLTPDTLQDCIAMIDLKRLPTELNVKLVSHPVFRSQRSFGAAALEWCWLAAGRCHIYLHGKHMLWDYAAGLLIAEEAGCVTCDILGNEVFAPSLKPKKVVAAVSQTLHKQWFEYISN